MRLAVAEYWDTSSVDSFTVMLRAAVVLQVLPEATSLEIGSPSHAAELNKFMRFFTACLNPFRPSS